MVDAPLNNEEVLKERQKQLLERARSGILKFLKEKGGALPLADMHEFSLNRYLIQHQAFSQLMETLVDDGLVSFDHATYTATITEAGQKHIAS